MIVIRDWELNRLLDALTRAAVTHDFGRGLTIRGYALTEDGRRVLAHDFRRRSAGVKVLNEAEVVFLQDTLWKSPHVALQVITGRMVVTVGFWVDNIEALINWMEGFLHHADTHTDTARLRDGQICLDRLV